MENESVISGITRVVKQCDEIKHILNGDFVSVWVFPSVSEVHLLPEAFFNLFEKPYNEVKYSDDESIELSVMVDGVKFITLVYREE